jgi:putative phosphoesterase
MRIGVISDTHNFFDPKIPKLFKGVDHILHAGDVGTAFILSQLEQIAPVTAVIGNTDEFLALNETETVELDGRKYMVHHIVGHPGSLEDALRGRILREEPDVVVFGHTHKRFCQMHNGVLYFNPGYSGKPRSGEDRSVAILRWDETVIRPEYLPL